LGKGGSKRLGERFELKSQAGAGGMGTVYQALDRRTGQRVAVKILNVKNIADAGRFDQEANLLQELAHPGIVRYVDHGLTGHGDPYIAMEWLEGETLDQRLARGKLAAAGVANLAARVLEALAAAHEHGIVHRDIKPSNVFLADWRLFNPRIIDFGVARRLEDPQRYTRRGVTVGTPSYSSPEQARAEADIDGRADIFSLGCVLFECLTGRPPFYGSSPRDVLTQIVTTPVPRLETRVEDIDLELVRLIDRMLIQDRKQRPSSARELAARFHDIAARLGTAGAVVDAGDGRDLAGERGLPPHGLGYGEARVHCALLVGFQPRKLRPPLRGELPAASRKRITSAVGVLLDGREADDSRGPAMRALAHELGLSIEAFAPGAYLLWPQRPGPIGDQVDEMVRAAARLRAAEPEARLSVAVGRAMLLAGSLAGPLPDRLTELLPELGGSVRLDEASARIIPARLVTRSPDGIPWLKAEDAAEVTVAAVDPREPPLLGRERDLGRLLDELTACADDESARVILLEGGTGIGKTRLARALVTLARQRRSEAAVFLLRGRKQDADRRLSLLAPLLGREDKLPAGAPAAARQAALVQRLDGLLARGPVLLVADDLQWGDRASLDALEAALRELGQRPLLLVGFARPELFVAGPPFARLPRVERLRMLPLPLAAGQALLRFHLRRVSPAVEEFVFDRWEGNPLFLRELTLPAAVAAGTAPDTVLGEIEPRLLALDEEPRRVLRAASLFGDRFEFEAVLALMGLRGRRSLEAALAALVEADLIRRVADGSGVHAFRQRLVREAAFAMLTPADRALGMSRARQVLEEAGKTIPELLLPIARWASSVSQVSHTSV
jgi:hypothetical protein